MPNPLSNSSQSQNIFFFFLEIFLFWNLSYRKHFFWLYIFQFLFFILSGFFCFLFCYYSCPHFSSFSHLHPSLRQSPNSLIRSSNFLVEFLGFSMYNIMSFANSDHFASSFSNWMPFICSYLIAVARSSSALLNRVKMDIPVLFLLLREMLLVFAYWVWCWL